MIEIRPTHKGDIDAIAPHMRTIDQIECRVWSEKTPRQALLMSSALSDEPYTITIDGRPTAMFGWSQDYGLGKDACVWFLGTSELHCYTREFLTLPKPYFKRMFEKYETVYNYVAKDNIKAIRFLKYHGFKFEEEVVKENMVFVKAVREKDV
jgi:hypothetical protein